MKPSPITLILALVLCLVTVACGGAGARDARSVAATEETASVDEGANGIDSEAPSDDGLGESRRRFTIVAEESTARFELDETLKSAETGWALGARVTVVGTTDQLFGGFSFVPDDLSTMQFDSLQIDAHSLKTNNYIRTRAIQTGILQSGTYPLITFEPTEVRGLPVSAEITPPITFTLDGTLTIRDIRLPQTLTITTTAITDDRIAGTAFTTVTRQAYGLEIVVAPHVTNVEDEVELYIDFVAVSE